jgi:anti-sigma factor RsiW
VTIAHDKGEQIIPEVTCQEIAEWDSAYLDDHAEDERKRLIALHLAVCEGCETYVKQIAMVRDTVGLLAKADDVPADLHRLRKAFVARPNGPPYYFR